MTIENTDAAAVYTYRLNPANRCEVQRRRNRPGARWESRPYRIYDNEHDARAAVFRLARISADGRSAIGAEEAR